MKTHLTYVQQIWKVDGRLSAQTYTAHRNTIGISPSGWRNLLKNTNIIKRQLFSSCIETRNVKNFVCLFLFLNLFIHLFYLLYERYLAPSSRLTIPTSRWITPSPVLILNVRTRPSGLLSVSTNIPIGQHPLVSDSVHMITRSPTSYFLPDINHLWRSCKFDKYSFFHLSESICRVGHGLPSVQNYFIKVFILLISWVSLGRS